MSAVPFKRQRRLEDEHDNAPMPEACPSREARWQRIVDGKTQVQERLVNETLEAFGSADTGESKTHGLFMPCGTGKTRTALRITQKLYEKKKANGQPFTVVFLVPTLELVRQTCLAWTEVLLQERTALPRFVFVCNDGDASKLKDGVASKLASPCRNQLSVDCHSAASLYGDGSDWLAAVRARSVPGFASDSLTVVICMYQSVVKLGSATASLIIHDEAHLRPSLKYAQKAIEQRVSAPFRLMMTGTPNVACNRVGHERTTTFAGKKIKII